MINSALEGKELPMSNTGFEADLILQPRRSERRAWMVAGAASGIAVLLAFCIFFMMLLSVCFLFSFILTIIYFVML